jgi:hypothetical protein
VRLLLALCAISAFYFVLLQLLNSEHFADDPSSPYFQNFAPGVIATNIARYTALYFDAGIPNNFASVPQGARWLYYLVPLLILAGAVIEGIRWRRMTVVIVLLLGLGCIAPLLPMPNMQHRLYLYLPSIFLSIATAAAADAIIRLLPRAQFGGRAVAAAALATVSIWASHDSGQQVFRNWWLTIGRENRQVFSHLFELPSFPEHARVAVINLPDYMPGVTVFAPGGGDALRLLDKGASLTVDCYVGGLPSTLDDARKPTHIIDYNGGRPVLTNGGSQQTPAPQ